MYVKEIFTIYLAVGSLFAFLLYGADKRKAEKGKWRISEKTLLAISFFGGALGGYAGMKVFRHKTKYWYFHVAHILGLVWQVSLCIFLWLR